MKEYFDYILNNYHAYGKVDSTSPIYDEVVRKLPNSLRNMIDNNKYEIKGSVGKGQMCFYPFVALMDKSITNTTQKGLYIVYLFKSDLSGFYLSLDQGITSFKKIYNKKALAIKNARKVANYFKDEIDDDYFSKGNIDLGKAKNSELGEGYAETNIISKYYEKGKYSENELIDDLERLIKIYTDIINHM